MSTQVFWRKFINFQTYDMKSCYNLQKGHKVPVLLEVISSSMIIGESFKTLRCREITAREEIKRVLIDSFEIPYAAG